MADQMYALYDAGSCQAVCTRSQISVECTMGLIDTDHYACDNCGTTIFMTRNQKSQLKKNPRSHVYCDQSCNMEDRERRKREDRAPWSWLGVNTVVDCLPMEEEPSEIYVGY